ncbi:MAG TPA: FKBP-type peptidyl-prolyl cis-trans isomerase [Cytophagaceae bacterium]
MLKKLLFLSGISSLIIFQSCNQYKTTDSGIKYKIIADSATAEVENGGIALINFIIKNDEDSVLLDTYKDLGPQQMPIQDGYLENAFALLSKGDSAEFIVAADSVYGPGPEGELPEGIKKGSKLKLLVKVENVFTKKEVDEEMARQEEFRNQIMEQYVQDTTTIAQYLDKNNIRAKKTINGIYYVVHKKGDGMSIQPGDSVNIHYTGKLMDGTVFDSSKDRGPLPVNVGMGEVIRGWDEGLMYLNKGDKATIYIPSALAYGPYEQPGIPANSTLVFDIEIMNN